MVRRGLKASAILFFLLLFLVTSFAAFHQAYPVTPSPQTVKENQLLLYVYNASGENYAYDWMNVFSSEGYSVSLVNYSDFSSSMNCSVIVVDPALDVNESLASSINATGKPVLALGLGGAQYLNHTGGVWFAHEVSGINNTIHFLSYHDDVHEVLREVNVSSMWLPFNGKFAFIDSSNSHVLVRDDAVGDHGFLSVAEKAVHIAMYNITPLYEVRDFYGSETFRMVMNAVDWLVRGAPRYRLLVDVSDVYGCVNVTINVSVYDNWEVGWCSETGEVCLNVTRGGKSVYTNSVNGCNVSFTTPTLEAGRYDVTVERDGCTATKSITVHAVQLSDLTYKGGLLMVRVLIDGVPAEGVTVNFSYVEGARMVLDFWSVKEGFTRVGGNTTNSSGWACMEFSSDGTVTVVAWNEEYRNYTYTTLTLLPELPSLQFPYLKVLSLQFFASLTSGGDLWVRGVGVASAILGAVALAWFRRMSF